jgi:protein-S-isoprenylcysteine O-methyltransferase Ste14
VEKTRIGLNTMLYIIIGCLAFLFLYIFDFNKITFIHKYLNICFLAGVLLLAYATLGILLSDLPIFELALGLRLIFGLLALLSLLLTFYSLFFALPFSTTYVAIESRNQVIDTGMYAVCRHPGVIWFLSFYIFLWLASGKSLIFWATIVWTGMDIVHVYVQDRWFFPKNLIGYTQYRRRVPFLIPSLASIKRGITDIRR